jgi:hypothetical protein
MWGGTAAADPGGCDDVTETSSAAEQDEMGSQIDSTRATAPFTQQGTDRRVDRHLRRGQRFHPRPRPRPPAGGRRARKGFRDSPLHESQRQGDQEAARSPSRPTRPWPAPIDHVPGVAILPRVVVISARWGHRIHPSCCHRCTARILPLRPLLRLPPAPRAAQTLAPVHRRRPGPPSRAFACD